MQHSYLWRCTQLLICAPCVGCMYDVKVNFNLLILSVYGWTCFLYELFINCPCTYFIHNAQLFMSLNNIVICCYALPADV